MAVHNPAAVQPIQGPPADAESCPSMIGPISFEAKQTGERSTGKPSAAFDVAGAGNVARSRWCDTRKTKERVNREHKLRPKPARQSPTLPMSGERKRSDAAWPKQPRLSSTLPKPVIRQIHLSTCLGREKSFTGKGRFHAASLKFQP